MLECNVHLWWKIAWIKHNSVWMLFPFFWRTLTSNEPRSFLDWINLYTSLWRSDKLTCSCIGISFMDGFALWNRYAFTEWAQWTSCILPDPITKLPKATVRLDGLRNQLTNVLQLIPFENLSWKHFLCVFYLPAMQISLLDDGINCKY